MALECVVTDCCSASVQAAREPIVSSSLLVKAQNKLEWTSGRYLISTAERHQYTPSFKFKSTDVNLLSCLVCLSNKNGRFGIDWSYRRSINLPVKGQLTMECNKHYTVSWFICILISYRCLGYRGCLGVISDPVCFLMSMAAVLCLLPTGNPGYWNTIG